LIIEAERPEDRDAVAAVNRAAFGGEDEAAIVERLRRDGGVVLSLVAREHESVIGHILFSALPVEIDGRRVRALALAPMAVLPARQSRGVGSELVREGLRLVSNGDWEAVFVVGHPQYYPRFGFSADLARKFASPFPGDHFMAMALKPGALDGDAGSVRYPPAFGF
jgi:putative acetyltransferase